MQEKTFTNYSAMLSMTDSWSDEKLESTIKEYKDQLDTHYNIRERSGQSCDFFRRNVDGLKRMQAERKRIKTANGFVLNNDHIKLLNVMRFKEGENSCIVGVPPEEKYIAKALGITSFDQNGDYHNADKERIDLLFAELQYAITEIIKNAFENPKE